jgi:threonine/homoserine/homoserine lactone efflux protein
MSSTYSAILSFALLAGLLTIIPGLDTALVLRAAITQGRPQAFATGLGVASGSLVWGAAAAAGVSALLVASRVGYDVVRVAGAAYLVYLGSRLLWSAWRDRAADSVPDGVVPPEGLGRSWLRGFATNLLNPKVGAFYLAVLPQFIPAHTFHLGFGVLLALVHDVEGMAWFTTLILGASWLRPRLSRPSVRRGVDATTGAVLVAFGLRLGLDRP